MARRKKERKEEEASEAWLLPYSDMLTLLLGLFIVVSAMSNVDSNKFNALKNEFSQVMSLNPIVIGIVGNIVQVGLLFTATPIKPDFKKLNPLNGLKQMFSLRALQNLAKSLVKLIIVGYLCYKKYVETIPTLTSLSEVGTGKVLLFMLNICKDLATQIGILLVVVSVFDYAFQRYTHMKSLKMSKQEIKDEMKQMEGDLQVKVQRKAKHREMIRNAVAQVKDVTVVLANPTHLAIARIKEEAKKQNVPIIENKPLARALYPKVDDGDFIPVEFYEAIAEVIAFVYKLEQEEKGKI